MVGFQVYRGKPDNNVPNANVTSAKTPLLKTRVKGWFCAAKKSPVKPRLAPSLCRFVANVLRLWRQRMGRKQCAALVYLRKPTSTRATSVNITAACKSPEHIVRFMAELTAGRSASGLQRVPKHTCAATVRRCFPTSPTASVAALCFWETSVAAPLVRVPRRRRFLHARISLGRTRTPASTGGVGGALLKAVTEGLITASPDSSS